MRRPAQHHLGPTATAWAHPYTGVLAAAVFYNDGGQGGGQPAPAVPTPADLATRTGQQPAEPTPPALVLPPAQRTTSDDREVMTDKYTGQPMTQGRFSQIMTKQYEKSRNAAFREMAEAAGLPFDPDNFDPAAFGQLLKDAQTARQAQMTEEQRRTEELSAREQQLQAREDAAKRREADAAKRDRDSKVRAALVRLGATGDDLDDAAALIRLADDADDTAITEAADKLKERRAELFGTTATAPQTLPPAPSGAPAGGNTPRQPVPGKDAVREAARKRAESMGLRPTG